MRRTLLIADGDAESIGLYRRFLTERGYDVEISSDALDCLKKLRQETPDVLVLDLELHWGGGDGVLAWLREETPKHGIPVILLAEARSRQDFTEASNSPVVGYLPKPFTLTALLDKVRSVDANGQDAWRNPRQAPELSELFIG